jgi:hypothetical protein
VIRALAIWISAKVVLCIIVVVLVLLVPSTASNFPFLVKDEFLKVVDVLLMGINRSRIYPSSEATVPLTNAILKPIKSFL